jgi:hypothetical protein
MAERLTRFEAADALPRYECAGYAALLAGAALSTITGVSNQVISGALPKSFATCSRHSVL